MLGLKYAEEKLTVLLKEARHLPAADAAALSNPFVVFYGFCFFVFSTSLNFGCTLEILRDTVKCYYLSMTKHEENVKNHVEMHYMNIE